MKALRVTSQKVLRLMCKESTTTSKGNGLMMRWVTMKMDSGWIRSSGLTLALTL